MAQITMVGCGEVGLAYAEALLSSSERPDVRLYDPRPPQAALTFAERTGLPIEQELGTWFGASDLVFVCTPGTILTVVINSLGPFLTEGTVIADMSTATVDAKRAAAAFCADRGVTYVDIAITGSVAASGAQTPLLYAGPSAPVLIGTLQELGAPLTVLDGAQPGDAIRVKLLRSVIMKGLEGLAVECLPAAEEYGVLDQLWVSLGDVDRVGFVNLLKAFTKTHARHAVRRAHEVTQAADQLDAIGLSATMTRATEERFNATAAATNAGSWPADETTEGAIQWLRTFSTNARV